MAYAMNSNEERIKELNSKFVIKSPNDFFPKNSSKLSTLVLSVAFTIAATFIVLIGVAYFFGEDGVIKSHKKPLYNNLSGKNKEAHQKSMILKI